jgi:hypothetical protein
MIAGRRILLIEDEFLVAAMLADVIESAGGQVTGRASTVAEGLDLAAQGGFDAAVLDWNLGGESGEQIARVLQANQISFVIATGYGSVSPEFADIGILSKPYSPAKLVQMLARLVG